MNAALLVDDATYIRTLNGPGTELDAWLYGSGVADYTDHVIQTWTVQYTGRVPLFPGQEGFFSPGSGGTAVHASTVIPAEITAEEPHLAGC